MLAKMTSTSSLTYSASQPKSPTLKQPSMETSSSSRWAALTFKSPFKSRTVHESKSSDTPTSGDGVKAQADSTVSPREVTAATTSKQPDISDSTTQVLADSPASEWGTTSTEQEPVAAADDHPDNSEGYYRRSFSRRLTVRVRNVAQLEEIQKKVEEFEQERDEQEVEYTEIDEDLSSLIIYAKATSIKPEWDWERQRATTVNQMFSFGEPKAVDLCTKDSKDMLACTERQLVRTYPKGTRFDSSNYDPMLMWRCGVQMVSLNFQYPDIFMHLNQGMFRRNGGCGYILKPAVMRRENPGEGSTPFDPDMKVPHPDVPPLDLEIELLSGQRLCPWKKKRSSVSVKINTYGIPADCAHSDRIPEATHTDVLWPQWGEERYVLKKTILMPELCLVYFLVEADRKVFGQNCIPVVSLQPGLKFIPLRTPGGELIPGSGLFVKIKKREATEPAATEAEEDDKAQEFTRRLGQLGRQETVDLDDNSIGESEADALDDHEMVTNEETFASNVFETSGEENRLIEEDEPMLSVSSMARRFTSPASLDSVAEFLNIINPQQCLTTLVDVHEDTCSIVNEK